MLFKLQFLLYNIKEKITRKNTIAEWWYYYWSKENVWCNGKDAQRHRWLGRLNIIWGINHMPKGMITNFK
jgi:hypothetical protein